MKKRILLITATALLTTVTATAVAAVTDESDPLATMVAENEATAALYYDGEHTAAGLAELGDDRPADARGHFRIGSVTKSFVATVVMQLVDEHRLRLDDPIEAHLPGVVPGGADVTVRQLLNHTSGLYDYMSEPGYSTNRWRGEDRFDDYAPRQLLDVAFAHEPYFAPGTDWRYSNTNYIVVGLLIEELTGADYGDAIRDRILKPLRLRHTSVPGHTPGLPGPHAHGYTEVDGATVDATEQDPSLDWAAGEMIATTADLTRYFEALLAGELTSRRSLAAMLDTVETDTFFEYGLGIQRFALPCGVSMYGHSGQLLGYTTYATAKATLSYNPGAEAPSQERVAEVFAGTYCD